MVGERLTGGNSAGHLVYTSDSGSATSANSLQF